MQIRTGEEIRHLGLEKSIVNLIFLRKSQLSQSAFQIDLKPSEYTQNLGFVNRSYEGCDIQPL